MIINDEINCNCITKERSKQKSTYNSSYNKICDIKENDYIEMMHNPESIINEGQENENIIITNNWENEKNEKINSIEGIQLKNDDIPLEKTMNISISSDNLFINDKNQNIYFQSDYDDKNKLYIPNFQNNSDINNFNVENSININNEERHLFKDQTLINVDVEDDLLNQNNENNKIFKNIELSYNNTNMHHSINQNNINNPIKLTTKNDKENHYIQIRKCKPNPQYQMIKIIFDGKVVTEKNLNEFDSTGMLHINFIYFNNYISIFFLINL